MTIIPANERMNFEILQKSKTTKTYEIKIDLRSDINLSQRYAPEYQDENVTIFAFEWMKDGLKRIRESIDNEILLNVDGMRKHHILAGDFTLKDLQIVARNESSNTNGEINFGNYMGISKGVIYSLKDLNRQTVIVCLADKKAFLCSIFLIETF